MRPIKTEHSNFLYKGPTPEIMDLPCEVIEELLEPAGSTSSVYSVWEPTDQERELIAQGANLKVGIYGLRPIPPLSLDVVNEEESSG